MQCGKDSAELLQVESPLMQCLSREKTRCQGVMVLLLVCAYFSRAVKANFSLIVSTSVASMAHIARYCVENAAHALGAQLPQKPTTFIEDEIATINILGSSAAC